MDGPRAQIRRCLGRDYPSHPTCQHTCGRQGPLWPACPVPLLGRGGPRLSSLLQSLPLGLLGPRSPGDFCEAQEVPSLWKLPREHHFRILGTGPGLRALRGWRVVLEPGPCRPRAWLALGSWCLSSSGEAWPQRPRRSQGPAVGHTASCPPPPACISSLGSPSRFPHALPGLLSHGYGGLPTDSTLLVHRMKPTHTVVNCWFCNQDTVVPYGNRNCWDCPHCEQYNGFQEVRPSHPGPAGPGP